MAGTVSRLRRSELLGQLVRFGVAGAAASAVYSVGYLLLALYVFPPKWEIAAVPPAFALGVICSFIVNSRWSFSGHDQSAGAAMRLRYIGVQIIGFLVNALIVWVGTALLHLPPWAPLVPAIASAAIITFLLNRFWVFR